MEKDLKSLIVLFKAHHHTFEQVKQTLQNESLNLNEFTALEALNSKGKLTTSELIDYILIPNSSMTYVLGNLEKKGLIERTRDQKDRRTQYLQLTEKGQDIFTDIYERHHNHMRSIFDVLTPEEEKVLQQLLKKVGKAAEER